MLEKKRKRTTSKKQKQTTTIVLVRFALGVDEGESGKENLVESKSACCGESKVVTV